VPEDSVADMVLHVELRWPQQVFDEVRHRERKKREIAKIVIHSDSCDKLKQLQ
jgi:hypothetical protein